MKRQLFARLFGKYTSGLGIVTGTVSQNKQLFAGLLRALTLALRSLCVFGNGSFADGRQAESSAK